MSQPDPPDAARAIDATRAADASQPGPTPMRQLTARELLLHRLTIGILRTMDPRQ